jgi:hypothetical protein
MLSGGGHKTQCEALQAALGHVAVEKQSGSVGTPGSTRVTAAGVCAVVDASGAAAGHVPEGIVADRTAHKPTHAVHTLPSEVLAIVFGFVDVKTLLLSVHAVCRSWKEAMSMM